MPVSGAAADTQCCLSAWMAAECPRFAASGTDLRSKVPPFCVSVGRGCSPKRAALTRKQRPIFLRFAASGAGVCLKVLRCASGRTFLLAPTWTSLKNAALLQKQRQTVRCFAAFGADVRSTEQRCRANSGKRSCVLHHPSRTVARKCCASAHAGGGGSLKSAALL